MYGEPFLIGFLDIRGSRFSGPEKNFFSVQGFSFSFAFQRTGGC